MKRGKPLRRTGFKRYPAGDKPCGEPKRKPECSVEGCNRPSRAKKMCTRHYRQVKTRGYTYERTHYEVCQAEGCESKPRTKSAQYCEKHYYRLRRNGTLETVAPRVPDAICIADGCDKPARSTTGECRNCYLRRKRNGDYEYRNTGEAAPNWVPDDEADYRVAHGRVKRKRGRASEYSCVDCGGPAFHWSYNHQSPDERWGTHENGCKVPFSLNIDDYEPRCVPCHKRFDLNHLKEKGGKNET